MTNQSDSAILSQLRAMGFSDELVETPRRIIISLGGKEKTAKCLTGDCTVMVTNGTLLRVDSLTPGVEIASISPEGEATVAVVKSVAMDGAHPTKKIGLSDGRCIKVTSEHKFYTRSGWVEANKLSIGDRVLVPQMLSVKPVELSVSFNEAAILGYLIADGGVTTTSARFTKGDKFIQDDFVDKATRCGFNTANYFYANRTESIGLSGSKFKTFRDRFGLYHGAAGKSFAAEVFSWNERLQDELLRAYFTCDGWVCATTSGGIQFGACSASKTLIMQIINLLLQRGIPVITRIQIVGGREYYRLEGSTASTIRFVDIVGFFGDKMKKADDLVSTLSVSPKRQGYLANSDKHGQREPEIGPRAMWGRISFIQDSGTAQVYDVEIAGNLQCFTANNILVHNTHFACTAPDPIFYINTDNGAEGVVNKFQAIGKKIYMYTARYVKGESQDKYKELWSGVKAAIFKACEYNKGSIVLDTASELYEMARLAHFGKLEQVLPHLYGRVNSEWQKEILQALYDSNMNAILIHKVKAVWVNDKRTGDYELAGFSDTGYKMQIKATTFREMITTTDADGNEITIPQFGLQITDCRTPASLMGMEIRNLIPVHDGELIIDPRLSFDNLLDLVHGKE